MSTEVWTLVIDRESDEGHGVEVFASYRDVLAVLPARLEREWGQYVRHQTQHGLVYDEAHFLDALGTLDVLDSAPEVVIESHELEAGGCPPRLAPANLHPFVDELVGKLTLEELRHLAAAGLSIAGAYGGDAEPSGGDVLDVIAERLVPAVPEWLPSIEADQTHEGLMWWAQLRDSRVGITVPVWNPTPSA